MAVATSTALATAVVASGAFSAMNSLKAGNQQAKAFTDQADFNAGIYDMQGTMIQEKKKVQDYQYGRAIARMRSSVISKTAGKGLTLSGSPLAIMADNESQMLFDQAISDYNLSVQGNFATSAAANTRYAGAQNARLATTQGRTNAFSTVLNTATNFALLKGFGMPKAGKL